MEQLDQLEAVSLVASCALISTAASHDSSPLTDRHVRVCCCHAALGNMPGYADKESPFSGNYGSVCAPAELGGRGVDAWRVLDGIPNANGVVRQVIGPLLPEEGMATHYYKEYWGVAAPSADVKTKWGVPVAALDGSFS